MFTFGVAHPQQLDCISYLFSPLVVVVCTPHSLGCVRHANRKTVKIACSPPPLFLRPEGLHQARCWVVFFFFFASEASQRAPCVSAHLHIPQALDPTPTAGLGRGPRLSTCSASAPKLPSTRQTGFNIATRSCNKRKKKKKRRRAAFSCSAGHMCRLDSTHSEQIQSVDLLKGSTQRVASRFSVW